MSIPTIYIQCKSKRLANTILQDGGKLQATEYTPFSETRHELPSLTLPHGTVIKFFTKYISGSPYANSYGNWDAKKQRIK